MGDVLDDLLKVEFDSDTGLGSIIAGGERRLLACLPRRDEATHRFARFGQSYSAGRIIPRSEWKDFSLEAFLPPVDDQNGHGACGGFAADCLLDTSRAIGGQTHANCSPWFNYAMCNGGSDSGCMVSDTMKALIEYGSPLDSTVPDKAWHKRMIPPNAYEEAKRFRLSQAFDCESFDAIVSAILCGFPVSYGILIGNRFQPDAEGVIRPWDGANVGGHALCGYAVKLIRGVWHIGTQNSWTERWGLKGRCWVPESYFRGQRWGVDAFAGMAVIDDPNNGDRDVPPASK